MFALYALALAANQASPPPSRMLAVIVYGADSCPTGEAGETVVCARKPEADRYRIPQPLREEAADKSPAARAWGSRVQELDEASAFTRPEGCSPVGSAGISGCTQLWFHQWWLDREAIASGQP